jgi:hypothetical protein
MIMPGALPSHRRLLSLAVVVAAAAAVALTSGGFPGGSEGNAANGPATVSGAVAAPATTPVSAHLRKHRNGDAPLPAMDSASADRRGAVLYFLMEASRPQPMFAR